jgi:nucleoside-diphosphate-sugar epimerase
MYHLAWAGVNGPSKADPTVQLNNIQLGINCAQLCKGIGVKKLLCAGTVAEQAVHSLPNLTQTSGGMMYGVAKHCAHLMLEDYCKNIGLQFVWMQFSNIYGVGNKTGNLVSYTLGELLKGNEASFGPAAQPYDFIYVDDLLEAVYRLGYSETPKACYYIGSGSPRILKEYLMKIGELAGMQEKVGIGIRPDDGIKYDFSMFDTTPLKEAIGDYVSTPFEEGIKKTINWLKAQE